MKKTKIICSIGPSTQKWENFKGLVDAGMNVARINFSHATMEERKIDEELVERANKELGTNIAILFDTKGPDLRTCTFDGDYIDLVEGETIDIVEEDVLGTQERISFNYKGILKDLKPGMSILVDDGFYKLVVEEASKDKVTCRIMNGGKIKSRRGVCIPGIKLDVPFVSDEDREDIKYACEHNGDYLALSFVNCAKDIEDVRALCKEYGREDMLIISKVETQYAMDNLDEIIDATDLVMIARGDLGIELEIEKIPSIQKKIANAAKEAEKICIIATEMLSTMQENPRPTRAEVSDVANAVLDGTDAVMLSSETAIGKYPVETVTTMNKIIDEIENEINYNDLLLEFSRKDKTDIPTAIAYSTVDSANRINANAIVCSTMTGLTAKKISHFRPSAPVIAISPIEKTVSGLTINYGIIPMKVPMLESTDEIIEKSTSVAKEALNLQKKDRIVIAGSFPLNVEYTNFLRIEEIKE